MIVIHVLQVITGVFVAGDGLALVIDYLLLADNLRGASTASTKAIAVVLKQVRVLFRD